LDYKNKEDYSKIKDILSDIKLEAIAVHRIAAKLIN